MDKLAELKNKRKNRNRTSSQSNRGDGSAELVQRLEKLEEELEEAKESERKMLESLAAQTKDFEQTKISLEEAKLEIASLQDSNKSLEAFTALSTGTTRHPRKHFKSMSMMSLSFAGEGDADMMSLRRELKLAVEAEEKSKKAMDGLAIALKEVSTDAKEAKRKLSAAQAELKNVKAEAERSKTALQSTEEKFQLASEEAGRLQFESEESMTTWKEKERGLKDCIKIFEGELKNAQEENDKLIESQRIIRDENSRLREMLKHAVSEATVVKESLEIARRENSQLKDTLSEKESNLQSIRQEYECLKVGEAAAQSSLKELKGMMDAMFSSDSAKTSAEVSPREAMGGERKVRLPAAADDEFCQSDGAQCNDMTSPMRQKKKTILRKFSDIMKKRNS